jgi:hypothetical protein
LGISWAKSPALEQKLGGMRCCPSLLRKPVTRFRHLPQRLLNTPIAIHLAKTEVVMAPLTDRLDIAACSAPLRLAVPIFAHAGRR